MKVYFFIGISFFVSALLMLLQMPFACCWWRPYLLVLPLIYWVFVAPEHVNIGLAACVGICLDLICNTYIGEHMLVLVTGVFLITKVHGQIKKHC